MVVFLKQQNCVVLYHVSVNIRNVSLYHIYAFMCPLCMSNLWALPLVDCHVSTTACVTDCFLQK